MSIATVRLSEKESGRKSINSRKPTEPNVDLEEFIVIDKEEENQFDMNRLV